MPEPLITLTDSGLYCAAADAYIDPWRPVRRALITHAHADHARPGSERYWAARPGAPLLARRLGTGQDIRGLDYGEPLKLGRAKISFYPAGHVLGSAQIRIERAAGGEVWVVSGDYKRDPDPTCAPFEVVPCDTFITEATFGLPIYRWPAASEVAREIHDWWQGNRARGRTTVIFAYALGKAQRLLAELAKHTADRAQFEQQPVLVHGAVQPLTKLYRQAGIDMLPTQTVSVERKSRPGEFAGRLVLAPPGANGTPWMRRFGDCATGFCSGWMRLRGQRQRRGYDRGFVISDHADWPGLIATVRATGAKRVLATHGNTAPLVRFLTEQGLRAEPLATEFSGEDGAAG